MYSFKNKNVFHDLQLYLYTRFNVIARKQSSVTVHNALPPAIIVLLDDVDDCSFVKCEFVVLVLLVTVDGNHCSNTRFIQHIVLYRPWISA